VVFTHLHIDHVGWSVTDGRPTFPNATYRCSEADWHHFMEHTKDQHDQFGPSEGVAVNTYEHLKSVQDRFEVHSGTGTLVPGVDVMSAPGHTPGSSVVVLSSGTDRAMLLGDVVHCPVQLVDDDWAGLVDVDPDMARRTRIALARELEGQDVPVAGAHFPGMKLGRLLPAQGRRQWVVP
jgi:glyoxylase-like metal-dependent hydrolase (beta-lactamase superfamily II)